MRLRDRCDIICGDWNLVEFGVDTTSERHINGVHITVPNEFLNGLGLEEVGVVDGGSSGTLTLSTIHTGTLMERSRLD